MEVVANGNSDRGSSGLTQVYSGARAAKGQNIVYVVVFLDGVVFRNALDDRCDIVSVKSWYLQRSLCG